MSIGRSFGKVERSMSGTNSSRGVKHPSRNVEHPSSVANLSSVTIPANVPLPFSTLPRIMYYAACGSHFRMRVLPPQGSVFLPSNALLGEVLCLDRLPDGLAVLGNSVHAALLSLF